MLISKDPRESEEYRDLIGALRNPVAQVALALVGIVTLVSVVVGLFL